MSYFLLRPKTDLTPVMTPDARFSTPTTPARAKLDSTMTKPSKPTPDFPLYAHRNGQWAKKIKGSIHYYIMGRGVIRKRP
jgi:hypothetical protein